MIDKIVLIRLLQGAIDALKEDQFEYGMYRGGVKDGQAKAQGIHRLVSS